MWLMHLLHREIAIYCYGSPTFALSTIFKSAIYLPYQSLLAGNKIAQAKLIQVGNHALEWLKVETMNLRAMVGIYLTKFPCNLVRNVLMFVMTVESCSTGFFMQYCVSITMQASTEIFKFPKSLLLFQDLLMRSEKTLVY